MGRMLTRYHRQPRTIRFDPRRPRSFRIRRATAIRRLMTNALNSQQSDLAVQATCAGSCSRIVAGASSVESFPGTVDSSSR